jgi:hypothetical protein
MTVNELVIIHNFFNVKCKALVPLARDRFAGQD